MSRESEYKAAVAEEQKRQREQGALQAELLAAEATRQADDLAAAQQARINDQNQAQNLYQAAQQNRDKSFADILAGYKLQEQETDAEMQRQIQADKEAAKMTGYAQLGSALANLFAVGGGNAVSQQHREFSQDWMRKADADIRERRSRIDNLRDRQRAVQMQLDQLRMGDAATALQNAQRMADQAYQDRIALSQARSNAVLAPAQYRQQVEDNAAQLGLQGMEKAASIGLHERQLAQSAQQHADSMALNLAKAGMKRDKDGNIVMDENSEVYKANKKALQQEAHKGKNVFYYNDIEGNLTPLYMTAEERNGFIQKAQAKLEEGERAKEFKQAYLSARDEMSKKGVVLMFANEDPELRREMSMYSDNPENQAIVYGGAEDFDKWAKASAGSR